MPEVRLEKVTKTYGKITALRDVSLEIHSGEYLCIVGPSGCGKTTLIKSIAGIVQPDSGETYIDGKSVTPLPVEDRGTGYVFQEIALFPHMNVYDNVSYGLMVKGESVDGRRGTVTEMLDMLSMRESSKFLPSELSGGARQKTAIARALASGSTLLLLDEPLGALDFKVRTVIRYELKRLVKGLGLTAVHVTHDQEEALSIADRIIVMKAGRVVEVGPPDELYLNPRNLFTAKFLGEANFFACRVLGLAGKTCRVDVGGTMLSIKRREDLDLNPGEDCVVAIRPEFVKLVHGRRSRANTLQGTVREESFLGDARSYGVETLNGLKAQLKVPASEEEPDIRVGDEVGIMLPEEHMLIYRYPPEGLEKELALE